MQRPASRPLLTGRIASRAQGSLPASRNRSGDSHHAIRLHAGILVQPIDDGVTPLRFVSNSIQVGRRPNEDRRAGDGHRRERGAIELVHGELAERRGSGNDRRDAILVQKIHTPVGVDRRRRIGAPEPMLPAQRARRRVQADASPSLTACAQLPRGRRECRVPHAAASGGVRPGDVQRRRAYQVPAALTGGNVTRPPPCGRAFESRPMAARGSRPSRDRGRPSVRAGLASLVPSLLESPAVSICLVSG